MSKLLELMPSVPATELYGRACQPVTEASRDDRVQSACRGPTEGDSVALTAGRVGTWLWDLPTGTVMIDPVLKRLLGYEDYTPCDDVPTWQQMVLYEDRERFAAAAEACRQGSAERLHVEHRRRHRDGSLRWFVSRATLVRDLDGRPFRVAGVDFDTTDMKQSEDQLTRLFELSLGMLCIAGPDGYFKYINPAFERTLGYGREELLARPFLDFVDPADRPATLAELQKLVEGQPTIYFENRYRCKDGAIRWLAWTAVPCPESGLIYATATDVTDHRQTEDKLRESEQRYRDLLAAVPAYTYSVHLADGAPVSTWYNWGCLPTTGYTPDEFETNPWLWLTIVHDDDRETVRRHVDRVLAGEEVPPLEHRIVHRDGTVRWIRNTIVRHLDEDRRLVRYEGLVENITERKRVESRFRQLLEAAPDAMVITDQRGTIVLVNEQTERLFGYSRDELLGQSVEVLVPERLRQRHHSHREAYLARPMLRPMAGRPELSAVRKDGREFPAEITLSPLETEEGILVTSAIRDITERKQTEQILRNKEAQLLAAQRIQRRLLPRTAPTLRGFDIAGRLHPAEFAAGDFFDYIGMPDGSLGVAIGDVSGHGFGAALWMATLRAHLRSLAKTVADIEKTFAAANTLLLEEAEHERFVTLLLARLDPSAKSLVYANAGHPTGYVIDEAGDVTHELESTGLPLAMSAEATFPLGRSVTLKPGDVVLLVTDGILEAESPQGEPFGWCRAVDVTRANRNRTAAEMLESLHRAVQEFSRRLKPADDATAVVIQVLPEA